MRRALGPVAWGLACGLALATSSNAASAQATPSGRVIPRRPIPIHVPPATTVPEATSDDVKDLRGRFGVERAERLACSADASDQLRGIARAASATSPEAVQWLAQLARDPARACGGMPSGATRAEGRLALARALAMHADDATARAALVAILEPAASAAGDERARDPEAMARLEMARRIAALALAQSTDTAKVEKLVALARENGPGSAAATAALIAFPPSGTTAWVRPLSPRAMRLIARLGERRAAGALLEAAAGHDVDSRAAALEALGHLGDARVLALALDVKTEDDARLRLAAASALVQLGAPEAAHAVEALLAEDALATRALPLAETTHGPGVARALAARAASAVDPAVRAAAIVALGRDPGAEGIEALAALTIDPMVRAETMDAIARSPSKSAMGALEKLSAATDAGLRRDAARAYVVRVRVRGESSAVLDRALGALARATDVRDRSLGVFALVLLGRDDGASALDDHDPVVRRAVYAALVTRDSARTRAMLLARRAREEDSAARAVLAGALVGTDADGAVSLRELLACAHAGGADAPVCILAFARRAGDAEAPAIDAFLGSRDAIVRAHAAMGLAESAEPTRSGRLAAAYALETDPLVRRAIVHGLSNTPDVPSAADVLAFASRFDPDAATRWIASNGAALLAPPPADDVAWVHLVDPGGAPPPTGPAGATGSLWPDDGVAMPIAFDPDGHALVPAPTGAARLVLAPTPYAAYVRTP